MFYDHQFLEDFRSHQRRLMASTSFTDEGFTNEATTARAAREDGRKSRRFRREGLAITPILAGLLAACSGDTEFIRLEIEKEVEVATSDVPTAVYLGDGNPAQLLGADLMPGTGTREIALDDVVSDRTGYGFQGTLNSDGVVRGDNNGVVITPLTALYEAVVNANGAAAGAGTTLLTALFGANHGIDPADIYDPTFYNPSRLSETDANALTAGSLDFKQDRISKVSVKILEDVYLDSSTMTLAELRTAVTVAGAPTYYDAATVIPAERVPNAPTLDTVRQDVDENNGGATTPDAYTFSADHIGYLDTDSGGDKVGDINTRGEITGLASITIIGVSARDTDADGDSIADGVISLVADSSGAGAISDLFATGVTDAQRTIDADDISRLRFTPTENFDGVAKIRFVATNSDPTPLTSPEEGPSLDIEVNKDPDAPTAVTLSKNTLVADDLVGDNADVGTFTVTDVDSENMYTYAIAGADAEHFEVAMVAGMPTLRYTGGMENLPTTGNDLTITVMVTDTAANSTIMQEFTIIGNVGPVSVGAFMGEVDADDTTVTPTEMDMGMITLTDSDDGVVDRVEIPASPHDSSSSALVLDDMTLMGMYQGMYGEFTFTFAPPTDASQPSMASISWVYNLTEMPVSPTKETPGFLGIKDGETAVDTVTYSPYDNLDAAGSGQSPIMITVTGSNVAPTAVTLSSSVVVPASIAGSGGSLLVGTLGAVDLTVGDMHCFELTGGAAMARFEIADDGTTLNYIGADDIMPGSSLEIQVTVTDLAKNTFLQTLMITVGGVYIIPDSVMGTPTDADRDFSGQFSVPEELDGSTTVVALGTLATAAGAGAGISLATDTSALDNELFMISGTAAGGYELNFEGADSGDYETLAERDRVFNLLFTIDPDGTPGNDDDYEEAYTIAGLSNVDEPATSVTFDEMGVMPGLGAGTVLPDDGTAGTVFDTGIDVTHDDPDALNFVFSVASGSLSSADGASEADILERFSVDAEDNLVVAQGARIYGNVTLTLTATAGVADTTELLNFGQAPLFIYSALTDSPTAGTAGADTIDLSTLGTVGAAGFFVSGGDDVDTITDSAGNDVIFAGLGNDTISLATGGADTIIYRFDSTSATSLRAFDGGDTITGFNPGEDRILFIDVSGSGAAEGVDAVSGASTTGAVSALTQAELSDMMGSALLPIITSSSGNAPNRQEFRLQGDFTDEIYGIVIEFNTQGRLTAAQGVDMGTAGALFSITFLESEVIPFDNVGTLGSQAWEPKLLERDFASSTVADGSALEDVLQFVEFDSTTSAPIYENTVQYLGYDDFVAEYGDIL